MKKLFLFIFAFVATNASAQYYVSLSGGAQMGSAGVLMGTTLSGDKATLTNEYGSFGKGLNTQLRAGYFFNETFGVELGVGYLHGADQDKDTYKTYLSMAPALGNATVSITDVSNVKAYARAYGLSAALIYNFNEHIYGKFGAITKVGGKTVAEATNVVNVTLAENVYAPAPAPAGTVAIPAGAPVKTVTTELEQEFKGRIPLGFIAAMGYKHKIAEHIHLFAELEYLGISVTRDKSKYTKFTSTDVSNLGAPTTTTTLAQLPVSAKEFEYVDSLPVGYTNTDPNQPTKVLSEIAPYSSFGINVGFTFSFGK